MFSVVGTWDFWIYSAVIVALVLTGMAGIYLASGFDPLTRSQLKIGLMCQPGEGRIAAIIVGAFVFCTMAVFTLGEVVCWVETSRRAQVSRWRRKPNGWCPVSYVIGTVMLGGGGYLLMFSWCR